jgi:hypothetical protein
VYKYGLLRRAVCKRFRISVLLIWSRLAVWSIQSLIHVMRRLKRPEHDGDTLVLHKRPWLIIAQTSQGCINTGVKEMQLPVFKIRSAFSLSKDMNYFITRLTQWIRS